MSAPSSSLSKVRICTYTLGMDRATCCFPCSLGHRPRISSQCHENYAKWAPSPGVKTKYSVFLHYPSRVSTEPHIYPMGPWDLTLNPQGPQGAMPTHGCPHEAHGMQLPHLPPGRPQPSPSVPIMATGLPSTCGVSAGIPTYVYHVHRTPRPTSLCPWDPLSVPGMSMLPPTAPRWTEGPLPSHPSAHGCTHC